MQATHIWGKFDLHGHKVIMLLLLALLSHESVGQTFKWARQHNPNYDERKISYGFMIGLHTSAYQVKYSDEFVTPALDTVHSVMTPFAPGFSLGFLVNLRLNPDLDLRLMPKAGFYDHNGATAQFRRLRTDPITVYARSCQGAVQKCLAQLVAVCASAGGNRETGIR